MWRLVAEKVKTLDRTIDGDGGALVGIGHYNQMLI